MKSTVGKFIFTSIAMLALSFTGSANPVTVKTGIYVSALQDINTSNGSFGADIWIWYNSPVKSEVDLLKTRDLINAIDHKVLVSDSEAKGSVTWAAEKIHGTFSNEFDIKNFPFDKHRLSFVLEESIADASELIFEADSKNSAIDSNVELQGWKIDDLEIKSDIHKYTSTFGDPSSTSGSTYARTVATLTISRHATGLFAKIATPLYISLAITIIAFFMTTKADDIFSGRMGLLVAMVFSVVINQQASEAAIGISATTTLIDKLHTQGLFAIFLSIAITLLARFLNDNDKEAAARRIDIATAALITTVIVVRSAMLINKAKNGLPL